MADPTRPDLSNKKLTQPRSTIFDLDPTLPISNAKFDIKWSYKRNKTIWYSYSKHHQQTLNVPSGDWIPEAIVQLIPGQSLLYLFILKKGLKIQYIFLHNKQTEISTFSKCALIFELLKVSQSRMSFLFWINFSSMTQPQCYWWVLQSISSGRVHAVQGGMKGRKRSFDIQWGFFQLWCTPWLLGEKALRIKAIKMMDRIGDRLERNLYIGQKTQTRNDFFFRSNNFKMRQSFSNDFTLFIQQMCWLMMYK